MIEFKAGVSLKNLKPQMLIALKIVEQEYDKFGTTTVITSGNDGKHKVGSKHYLGEALDFRTKTVGLARQLVQAIWEKLNPIGFDVLFEDEKGPNEHMHVEYDPKT
jgi:hypothetical protein